MLSLASLDQHQTRGRACFALRGSLPAAANEYAQDWPASCRAGITHLTPVAPNSTGRGDVPGAFPSHRRAGILLPSQRRSRMRIPSICASGTLSIGATACQRSRAQSIPVEPVSQGIAHRIVHLNRLSCSPSLDGFRAIGKELTCGAKPLPPDGKIYD